ncbi:MAG: glycosyltransferase [Candidatus Latescibacteria bacterium]|nr:glycosyltransferase [Candidatus Latescibacterota bacterium]NIM66517.1 glycosyltransferase [Candidatus Latescibacterota bacterium]NIO02997.1 glycosyltransferase [Candidatus Latescibacterota bacterium]NIO30132.1 glycosyltransferase [Candidatus Latescibacterota bacterium]NIO57751.1 glycosyltransferase [Candidatus Latescibacterota bacterium]
MLKRNPKNTSPGRKGKLVYITSTFPVLRETFISREIIELEKRGIELIVVSLKNTPQSVGQEELPHAKVFYLPFFFSLSLLRASAKVFLERSSNIVREAARILWALRKRPGRMLKFLAILPKSLCLIDIFRRENILHLHAHFATVPTTCAFFISKVSGLPFSFTAHAWDIYVKGTELLLAEKMRAADRVITVSNHNHGHLLSLGGPGDKVKVVYQGLELERYRFPEKAPREVPLIVAGGGLEPKKGVHIVLQALAELMMRGIRFEAEIFGDGPERLRLVQLALSLNLGTNVSFVGSMPHQGIIRLFQRADIFVMASIRARNGSMEGLPNVLAEAMACGATVVASRLSGIPELVRDGVDGILVPAGDAIMLADSLVNLLLDNELRRRLSLNGRKRVEAFFDLRNNISPLAEYFEQALKLPESSA